MATQVEVPQTPPVETPNPRKFSRTIPPPQDAQGNVIGVAQTFYGATEQELIDNLAKAQEHATVRIRELSRKTTLEEASYSAPEGADAFEDIPLPQPREITSEARTTLATRFSHPETVVEAFDELYEARTGLKPEQGAKLQAQQARDAAQVKALEAARLFMSAHPEFVPCPENRDALNQFFMTRKIGPTLKNFELAFKELSANGLLVLAQEEPAPEVPEPPVVEAAPPAEVRIEPPAEVPAPQSVIPSALTSRSASGGGSPARKKGPTAQELAMMTADELKKHYESTGQWPHNAKAVRQ
jgi:hypothetical protein